MPICFPVDLAATLADRKICGESPCCRFPSGIIMHLTAPELSPDAAFADYMRYGGFPYLSTMKKTPEKAAVYPEGIYNTVIIKDIEDRQNRRENDPFKPENNRYCTAENNRPLYGKCGRQSTVSVKSVTDYLTSNGRKISPNTVSDYMEALKESFIFYKADAYRYRWKTISEIQFQMVRC